MNGLPKPILGEINALTIATPDLERSLAFYQRLGLAEVMRAEWPFPWIQVSDGALLIMLRKDPVPYLALTYYVKHIDKVVAALEKKGVAFEVKAKKTDMLKRYLLRSPDGLPITLVSMVDGFKLPPGPSMLHMPPADYFNPEKYVNKTCGLFGELAHPVKDLEQSLAYWTLLGFTAVSKFTAPYPWAIITDGLSAVGLHQTDHFQGAAITFFAADMGEKINKLKQAGLTDYTVKGPADIIVATPEQQQVFLFSMGGPKEQTKREPHVVAQPVIETKRLLLKELNPDTMKELFTMCTDEEIMAHLGLNTPEELETERYKFTNGLTTYRTSYKRWVLVEKATGKTIGSGGFHNWYDMHKRAELGYAMTDEAAKGKGYMTEAVAAFLKTGFEDMRLNRIEAFVGPHNPPSLKIVGGFGFVQEGILRQHFCKNGVMEDSICFSLLASEYEAARKKWKNAVNSD